MFLSRSVDAIRLITVILMVACACPQTVPAQSDLSLEPYSAFVVEESVHARCGPSSEFYRTDPLRHGQEVEIYAETDDGWLGIRPPAESFSWIPAEAVEVDGKEETGVVIEDRTVAWIGTQLGRARKYRWQVQLAKGEPVTVVGRSEREGPDGPQLWYRIVPPSGEYRWVHRDQVVFSSEDLVASIRRQTAGEGVADDDSFAGGPKFARTPPAQSRTQLEPDDMVDTGSPTSSRRNTPTPSEFAAGGTSEVDQDVPVGSGVAITGTTRNEKRWVGDAVSADSPEAIARVETEQSAGGKLLGALAFLGRPRLLEIGATPAAPNDNESAGDTNWVVAAGKSLASITGGNQTQQQIATPVTQFADASSLSVSPSGTVITASGQHPIPATAALGAPAPLANPVREVTAERIRQIEFGTRGAGVEALNLILSRLMAARSTAAETQPVARAARTLASSSADAVEAGRARLIAERSEQYIRLAYRRDGDVVIRSNEAPMIPGPPILQASAAQRPVERSVERSVERATTAVVSSTGYLVQVYSARANSPPLALTDNRGRTIAYVTPLPGVNLRTHLNSHVQISGNQGYVTGLNTPHILASQAVATPD
jgi:hypothetical protein